MSPESETLVAEPTSSGARPPVALVLVVGVVAISFAAIFFKKSQPTNPLVASAIRLLFAATLLSPWVIRGWRRGTFDGVQVRHAAGGGLAYSVHFGAWVASLGMTSVTASVTAVTASPLLLALVGLVTGKDAPTRRLWVSLGLAVAGLTVVAVHDAGGSEGALLGDALALLGAAAMAMYLLIGRRLGSQLDVMAYTGVATFVGGTTLTVACLVGGIPLEASSDEAVFYLALAALVPQLIGHTSLTWALRHTTPARVGTATLGEPVGSTLLAWLWLGESVALTVVVGCVITLGAVALALSGPPSSSDVR